MSPQATRPAQRATESRTTAVAERIEARQAELDALVLDIYEVAGDDRAAIQAWEERA